MTIDNDHDRSLEDVWRDILTRNGVSEAQAEDIVTLTFGTPALTRDIPDIEDVPDIARDALADTEFETYLDDDVDPERVEKQLVSALEDALHGNLSGPASVSDATLAQEFEPGRVPPRPEKPDGALAQPDRAPAYKSAAAARAAESSLEEDTIDRIATVLDDIMTEHDLETEDLYAALERLEENRSE
jgi:arylsulfatase A-like enzyme